MKNKNWDIKLGEFLLEQAPRTFKYGVCDCVMFVARAIKIQVNEDILRGNDYKSLKDGIRKLNEHGYKDFGQVLSDRFKMLENGRMAQRGDIATKKYKGINAFGIVWQKGQVFFKRDKGYVIEKISDVEKVWRVA